MARTKLSPSDRMPLYEQLAADLRYRIRGGEFDADQRLPSKAALAADYDVSLRTVDTAIGVLKAEGIIIPTPGKRMFILSPEERNGRTPRRRSTDR